MLLPLLAAAGLRGALAAAGVVPFNSDEAVVALMARHITQGARPIFFYGQAYMGSLDAFLVAAGFRLFGEHVWVIRAVQIALACALVWTGAQLAEGVFRSRRAGLLAAWLLALPAVNLVLYTTVSLGGYGEALLLGNLMLLAGLQAGKRGSGQVGKWASGQVCKWISWRAVYVGFLAGLGAWAFGLSLAYALPAAAAVLTADDGLPSTVHRLRSSVLGLLFGGLAGAFPLWIFAARHGFGVLLREFTGGAIAGVSGAPAWAEPFVHAFSLLLLGSTVTFGLRPPWGVTWLMLPLLPFALGFWVLTIAWGGRAARRGTGATAKGVRTLWGVVGMVVLGFLFTPFGNDPSGRYFLPIMVALSIFAAGMLDDGIRRWPRWGWAVFGLLLVYNLGGVVQSARRYPPGLTTQFDAVTQVDHRYLPALMDFLREQGETRGYTNYWVAYPLAFRSQEGLIFVPRLPYHEDFRYTPRDDRYLPYDALVTDAERAAYITTNHPALDARLRAYFAAQGVTWQETQIGDYHVFYALSRKVAPPEWER